MSAATIQQVPIVDLHKSLPISETNETWYESFLPLLKDQKGIEQFKVPAKHMFRDLLFLDKTHDCVAFLAEPTINYATCLFYLGIDP